MKLVIQIAFKFLFGKKSKGIINVISTISITGVIVGTIALLVILSVFNGLHGLIGNLYGSFDPNLKITPARGKVFSLDSIPIDKILAHPDVKAVSQQLEDNALLVYGKREVTAVVLGVDSQFTKVSGIDSIITEGQYRLKNKQGYQGVIGYVLADQLNARVTFLTGLAIHSPKRNKKINLMMPEQGINSQMVFLSGVFLVKQIEYDSKYVIVDINLARELFQYKDSEVTALAISTKKGANIDQVKKDITNLVGTNLKVKNQQEQHANFYKMMKIEKVMAYLILCFILIIATFNLIGTMSMLIFDKKESISTLKSMGANKKSITQIFLTEGALISIIGVILGVILGSILTLLQQHFGLIKFYGGGSFVVDSYPVQIKLLDIFIVMITVFSIGFMATWYPVRVLIKKYYNAIND